MNARSDIRHPRLLGPDLTEKARLRPSRASVTLNMTPLSSASITLPEGEATASVRDFMEIYGPGGSLGVYRIASAKTIYGNQQELTLEHGIVTLEDAMIAADTVLSGNMKAKLTTLLGFQSRKMWVLGDVEVAGDQKDVDAGGSNVLEAVLSVVGSDETAMIAFDQSVFPWVLHVRKCPSGISCECRLNRNLFGVNVQLDDADLCTRVTVEDADGGFHTYDADTVSTWGVVHRSITAKEGDDPGKEGRKYLEKHKNPALSVEIDALELARQTGEPFDSFGIGQRCRVVLPEWGVAMDERIMSIAYTDLFGKPDQVRLTLSVTRSDTSTRLASLRSAARSASRGVGRALKYYHELDDEARIMAHKITLLGDDIELRATWEGLNKVDEKHTALHNEVSIELDAAKAELRLKASQSETDRITATLNEAMITLSGAEASIELLAKRTDKNTGDITAAGTRLDGINATLTDFAGKVDDQDNLLSGVQVRLNGIDQTLIQQAGQISAQGNLISGAELRMDGLEGKIDLKVSKDGLISEINMSPGSVRISASKVVLDGYVTASQIEATNAIITNLMAGRETATSIVTDSIGINSHLTIFGHQADWNSRSFGTSLSNAATRTVQRENITYLDGDGEKKTLSVVTGITNLNSQQTLNTTTYRFLGYGN